ncbi:acetyl-CoA carboxylase biotin carboxyl carrier protein subunit [Archaeoglobales archaeon]|nr:MAG: acetyl-CoA carboxylase biotin carboxyl carrier protein subunit [Archaeoglobales archaeon]
MKYEVKVSGKKYEVEIKEVSPSVFEVEVNGKKATIEVEEVGVKLKPVKVIKEEVMLREVEEKPIKIEGNAITAPMAGTVTKILKNEGDEVKAGETVLIIEAMKMENPITSPSDGLISKVVVNEGDKVATGDALVYLS